ncbi:anthranilate phosphoribosyltransferase [Candidatus Marsarchaeota G2 archaeon OSP_D]|uniref:Anthranilate phosphoribosyltransferase n=2 Tax=Candidatus Marsarchaeota group 2 TaxID=2203771 RepID=A0A2R6B2T5_9ARCH|nr:MAG: anthranilate phosphoribosyltransferase [Candidatus Marsarchaeota G2 archaeon OSP_D]PSN92915.1 MAG: anthranilate phosphoribosyltransferase [Candidatus Marsarchaeota G2 archaeon ECH_B_SAG-M15]
MSAVRGALIKAMEGCNLSPQEAESVLLEVLDGSATDAQIGALLVALKLKGETYEELAGFARGLMKKALRVNLSGGRLMDTAGTGGDRFKTFNVSTAAAFVLAAGGLRVAKHGNRSVSSTSGSADLMEAFGVRLEVDPQTVAACVEGAGIGFMYAPTFHPALKRVAGIRRELGFRTIFNMLGPLVNPAGVKRQLLGVAEPFMVDVMAKALNELGVEFACVVHGTEGMDEVSINSPTIMALVDSGAVKHVTLTPRELGLESAEPSQLTCRDVRDSALTVYRILSGRSGLGDPKTRLVAANAAVGFMVGGVVDSVSEGVQLALSTIESGRAADRLRELVRLSGGDPSKLEAIERVV